MAERRQATKTASKSAGKSGTGASARSGSGGSSRGRAGGGRGSGGTSDVSYNLVSVVYHALQGAETYGIYANDAEQDGDARLAEFFRGLQEEDLARADRAKELLRDHL